MTKKRVMFVQRELNARGLDVGTVDGVAGPKTLAALAQIEAIPKHWSKQRKIIGFIQEMAKEKGIESGKTDGYWGPQTEFAFESLQKLLEDQKPPAPWRPEDNPNQNPNDWPNQNSQQDLLDFYGEIGTNHTRIQLPYPHKLAWNTSRTINGSVAKIHRLHQACFFSLGIQMRCRILNGVILLQR